MTHPTQPLQIYPTAHIADKASLHTSTSAPYPIIINAHCVVHPFARLDASSGPIVLGERCVVWEKAAIGSARSASRPTSSSGRPRPEREEEEDEERERVKVNTVTIGDGTVVQPHAKIPGPATIGAKCNIGVAVEIGAGAVLGEGVSVASGTRVEDSGVIEKGSVVFGEGRVRKPGRGASEAVQQDLEKAREMREEGEERHRVLTGKLVKGTAGGTRFTG